MNEAAPLCLHRGTILPEWIDYNGHMNVAYYVLVFDQGTDGLLDYLGMDADYRRRSGFSTYVLEAHITYEREMKAGEPYRVTVQLLDADAKRLHYFEHLYREGDDTLCATTEIMLIHMDMSTVRSTPMPESVRENVSALLEAHAALPRPPQAGRVIGIGAGRPA
ncbi:MAG: thioesterase family protein [Gammaproteobacteria bacterium]|nr:thioesterase family protein [Gammaproteobacteria bacterium]